MASDNEACVNDPNFAVICSFFNKFGKICGVQLPKVKDLQAMLEQSQEVHPALIDLHVKLLRKARRTVHLDKWERALVKFIHTYSNQDAWNLEHLGYKKLKLPQRLFILKNLLEMQFDNAKFKNALLQSSADDLRLEPIGKDKKGNSYWYQVDEDCNLRVYKENLDEESWTLVAQTREELADLISTLGGLEKNGSNTTSNEDSNSIATINSLLTSKNNDDSITNDTIKIVSATDKSKSKETEDSEEFLSPDDEDNYFDDDIVNDNAKDGMDDDKKEKKINGNGVKSCVNNSYENKARSKKRKCKSLSEEDHSVNKKMKKDVSDIINDEPTSSNNSDESEYGAAIEEPVMIVTGQGSGVDCDAGNPGESGTAENSLSDTKEVRNDSTTQSVQDSSTDVETALKSPDDEQNSGESLIISDTNVKERKPLMYFGQPGCLKLNPVMVRTAGHANFLNTNYSKIQDKVDVCNANDNKALTTNCSDLDKSHSGQDIADSVSLSNKSNEYAMDTKVGDEESIFLSKGNNITFNNDSLNEKSLSESFINKSLNETTFSTLLYEVTNLSIITPNASIASIESSLIDDSKSALNKSEIVSSNSTDDRTSTASISPKLKECDNEGYLKIDNTSENIQDQQSITLKSNLEEDISNLNETKKDFLSIKTTIAHDEKPKDKEHNKSSAFFVEVEANVININLNTGLDTQTELISVEKESLEKKCDKDSPQNDLLKNKNNLNEHDTVLDSISEKNIKLSSNIDLISKSTEDISTVKCDECNSTNKILINEKEKKEKAVNEDFLEVVTDTDVKSEKIKEESEMIEFKSTVDTENGLLLSETNISTKEHKDVQRISEILSHTTVENVDQAHSVNLNVNDSNEIDNNLNSHEILQKEPTSCFNNEIVKTTELNLQNETNRVGLINCEFSSANTKYNTLIGDDNKIQNITSFGHKEANQDEHIEQSDVCIEKIYETTQYKKEEQILGKEVTKTSEDHIEGISNEENLKTSMICSDNKNIKFVSDASISEIDKSKEVCTNTLKETAEKEPTNKKPVEFIAGVMEDSQNNLLKKENIKNIICATMKSEIKNVTDGCNTKIISKCNKNFNSSEELVKSRDPEGEKIKIILDKDSSVENKSSEKGNGNHECKETDLILEKSEQLTNTLIANKDSMEIESDALKQNNCLSNTITKNQENDSNKFFLNQNKQKIFQLIPLNCK
ncbi:remodeling and spacing factor 1-like [Ctenocephalides felis]|uniref:remodeling and spacing factor 1-like n=1 Tax=Ctenocephalides felis TaxID=7515 RepID=UPI000E6E54B0|nr:remodeling and spacing factor 1-like [Ctenocephalides felis]